MFNAANMTFNFWVHETSKIKGPELLFFWACSDRFSEGFAKTKLKSYILTWILPKKLHVIKQLIVFMGGWKLFTFIFCQIDITLAHLSSAYSLSLQERKSSFPSIFINGCQGYVSGALLRDNFFKIKILFIQKLFNFNEICWQSP